MTERVAWWSVLATGLLLIAAFAALSRTAGGDTATRSAGAATAAVLLGCSYGLARRRRWALGTGFFLGLFWFVSVVALGLQARLSPPVALGWLAWALAMMLATVRTRPDVEPHLHPQG